MRTLGSRQYRQPYFPHGPARSYLIGESLDNGRVWADESELIFLADFGEVVILGQKAGTRMNSVSAGDERRADNVGDVEIALGRRGRADADGLVSEPHMQGIAVRFRIDRNRGDAQVTAGTDDPHGDLAAVRNEYLAEHNVFVLMREVIHAAPEVRPFRSVSLPTCPGASRASGNGGSGVSFRAMTPVQRSPNVPKADGGELL